MWCITGFAVGVWIFFTSLDSERAFVVDNGGHSPTSHGISLWTEHKIMYAAVRTVAGDLWQVECDVPERTWMQISWNWYSTTGLGLYINGTECAHVANSTHVQPIGTFFGSSAEFVFGRNGLNEKEYGSFLLDEFYFRVQHVTTAEIKQLYLLSGKSEPYTD